MADPFDRGVAMATKREQLAAKMRQTPGGFVPPYVTAAFSPYDWNSDEFQDWAAGVRYGTSLAHGRADHG